VPIIGLHGRIPGSDTPTKSQAARRAVAPRAVAFHHRLPRRPPGRTGRSSPMPTPTPTPTRAAPAACWCLEGHHGICYHFGAHKRSGSMRRTPRRRPSD